MGQVLEFKGKEKKPDRKPQGVWARLKEKWRDVLEKRRIEKENEKRITADSATMNFRTAKILVAIDYGSNELLDIADATDTHGEVIYGELLDLLGRGIVEKEKGSYKLSAYGQKLVDKLMENEEIKEYAERYEIV